MTKMKLPDLWSQEREVLELHLQERHSQAEVGRRLGISRDQVYRTTVKIRRRARIFFQAKGWFE